MIVRFMVWKEKISQIVMSRRTSSASFMTWTMVEKIQLFLYFISDFISAGFRYRTRYKSIINKTKTRFRNEITHQDIRSTVFLHTEEHSRS